MPVHTGTNVWINTQGHTCLCTQEQTCNIFCWPCFIWGWPCTKERKEQQEPTAAHPLHGHHTCLDRSGKRTVGKELWPLCSLHAFLANSSAHRARDAACSPSSQPAHFSAHPNPNPCLSHILHCWHFLRPPRLSIWLAVHSRESSYLAGPGFFHVAKTKQGRKQPSSVAQVPRAWALVSISTESEAFPLLFLPEVHVLGVAMRWLDANSIMHCDFHKTKTEIQ